jgi:hypothetical protein
MRFAHTIANALLAASAVAQTVVPFTLDGVLEE